MPIKIIFTLLILHLTGFALVAQSPVVAFTSGYLTTSSAVGPYTNTPAPNSGTFSPCTSTVYNYSYSNGTNNTLKITGITTNGKSYSVAPATAYIRLRRVNNAGVTGKRSIIFLESTTGPTSGCPISGRFDFKSAYQDVMEVFLNNTIINQGTDNIFTNVGNGDGNNNNIERMDFIVPGGVATISAPDAGFALFDRGINNAHDPFRIVAITSLDANGDPASYATVKSCVGGNGTNNGSYGHPSLLNGNKDLSVYVLRKEEAETRLRSSAAINQQLGGVFFSFADLGIPINQKIYGYSLLGPDGLANPSSAQILNMNDPTIYPTNTTENVGGGLDLVAINAIFISGPVLATLNTELKSSEVNGNISVSWSVTNPEMQSSIELERSVNGANFISVYSGVLNSSFVEGTYNENNNGGLFFYRLKIILPDGNVYYSRIIKHQQKMTQVKVFPSVIHKGQLLTVMGLPDDLYKTVITSTEGKEIINSTTVQNGSGIIEIPENMVSKGLYFISFISRDQKVFTASKIIID